MIGRRGQIRVLPAAMLLSPSAAAACASLGEQAEIDAADAVVDGIALCSAEEGRCQLRAVEAVKQDRLRRGPAGTCILRYDPGAHERLAREIDEGLPFNICFSPWEPESRRVEGRFYLDRVRGGYRPRQDSARGKAARSDDPEGQQ